MPVNIRQRQRTGAQRGRPHRSAAGHPSNHQNPPSPSPTIESASGCLRCGRSAHRSCAIRDRVLASVRAVSIGQRGRPGPSHPGQRPAERSRVPATYRPDRTARRQQPELLVCRPESRLADVGRRACCTLEPGIRRTGRPPPEPRHIVAQQLPALCLQEHRIGCKGASSLKSSDMPASRASPSSRIRLVVPARPAGQGTHPADRRRPVHRPGHPRRCR